MLLVVFQSSPDAIGYEDSIRNVIGAFRSVLWHSLRTVGGRVILSLLVLLESVNKSFVQWGLLLTTILSW